MISWIRSLQVRLLILAIPAAIVPEAAPAQGVHEADSLSASFRKAAERALPSVVAIRTQFDAVPGPIRPGLPGFSRFRPGFQAQSRTLASGIVIDAQRGWILTTASALAGLSQVTVGFPDGRETICERIVHDPQSDLAVLSIDPKAGTLVQADWGDAESVHLGDWVLSLGRPTGTTQAVSAGIVSGRETHQTALAGSRVDVIRSDVAIAASGSGGPLVNLTGQVVGINRLPQAVMQPPDGFNIAITADQAKRVATELMESGRVRRGYLGLTLGGGAPDAASGPDSLVITGISPTGPADEAGFQIGDRIIAIDGRAVAELEAVTRVVEGSPVGSEFRIEVDRGGKRRVLTVKSRARPEPARAIAPGVRFPDRRLRPRQLPRDGGSPQPAPRRNPPLQSEGPDEPEQPGLIPPAPEVEAPAAKPRDP